MSEQYRGFTIEYQPGQFTVEAIVKNGRGGRIWSLQAVGNDKDDARRIIHNQIDYYLSESHSYDYDTQVERDYDRTIDDFLAGTGRV